jgi:O-antigen/teichoic acid export membrane protein
MMALAPIITRLYGPDAFGQLGTFIAIAAVVSPLAAMAYPIAIILPRDDRDAFRLVGLSAILALLIAALATIAFWLGGDRLASALGAETISGYLFLIPLTMLFAAWVQIAQQWLIRKQEYKIIARSAIVQSAFLNIAQAGLGWFHPAGAVLIALSVMGNVVHAMILLIGARLRSQYRASALCEKPTMSLRQLAHKYRDFPFYRAPQDFINAASQSLPVLMLAALFSPTAAGFYTLGRSVMGMPSALIGKAVGDVFYPRITTAAAGGEDLPKYIARATGILFCIGIFPFGLVMAAGPWLFKFVFGSDWAMAGEYARWLALFFLFNFINKPSVAAVPVLGIQRGLLIYEAFSTGGKVLGLLVGFYWFGSDLWAVALFSIVGVIAYGIMIFWIFWHSIQWKKNAETS